MSILQPMISVPDPFAASSASGPLPPPAPKRLKSLDVFRGITIAAMLLVNNPGSWEHMYWPLAHAKWNGCTPTDLIFPFFLFIVGVSTVFSLAKRRSSTEVTRGILFRRILMRGGIIIALGLFLHSLPSKPQPKSVAGAQAATQVAEQQTPRNGIYHPSTIRFPGVLQRIGVCYIIAATIILFTPWPAQLVSIISLLVLNGYLMLHVPYGPDYHKGGWEKSDNFAGYVDGKVFGQHNSSRGEYYFDPEGLISTIPAIATTLLGGLAGLVLRRNEDPGTKLGGLFSLGVIVLAFGWAMQSWMPLNKMLWSPSYAVHTAGLAMLGLGLCYWVIDLKGWWKWSHPFIWFGMNAITAFVLSGIVARAMNFIVLKDGVILRNFLGNGLNEHLTQLTGSFATANNLSLAWALCHVIVFAMLMWVLYALKIFIKV